MFRLLKMLKPSLILIIVCIMLVSIIGIASLLLPDRMSKIIGEGITAEYIYEEAPDGSPVYISIMGSEKIPLPKFIYDNAGELVLTQDNEGDYIATFTMVMYPPYYKIEKDKDGKIIELTYPKDNEIESIPMPMFKRTTDGKADSPLKQGYLVLDDYNKPQIMKKQVSHLDIIWKNGVIMIFITLISSIASIIVAFLSSKIGMRFGKDVRSNLFRKTVYFSQEEEDKFGTASLITRMTNDVTQVQMIIVMALRMMLIVPVMFIGGLIMAFSKDPKMTGILLISAPLVLLIIGFVAIKIVPLFKKMQKKIDYLTLVSRENITGVRVIRAFGQDERERKRFKFANTQVTNLAIKAARTIAIMFPSMQFIMSMTGIGVMIIAINRIDTQLMLGFIDFTTLGNMMAVTQYMMQIMMSIIMFSIIFIMVPRASVSATRINEIMDAVNNINDPEKSENAENKGTLEFNSVSFSFPNAANNVLTDISFKINKGETIAIIGSTGSGKSTLINLIPRLYDVTVGKILVDGVNVKNYLQKDLRAKIGFVSQKAVLFEGTIRENIAYGKPNATEDEIIQAAKIAQADEFIDKLDEGYDYWIEQAGANLSGGQKQRLAIARAICRKPSIYVFDDSFSALDFKTDKKLRKALKSEIKDSSVIIVAQRIGTIMNADRIIVMQDGRIVGIGKHKDLLRNCDVYKELAISQMSEQELLLTDVSKDLSGGTII